MSMRHNPSYGFVMELNEENLKYLGLWDRLSAETQGDVKDGVISPGDLPNDLNEALYTLPSTPDVFDLDDEDETGELEVGKNYLCWGVFDLLPHTLLPEPFRKAWEDEKLELAAWAKFG